MLGSCLTKVLSESFGEVVEVNRSGEQVVSTSKVVRITGLNERNLEDAFNGLQLDYVINAVGLIRQLINDASPADEKLAFEVNTEFPINLENFCDYKGIKVIQIGTDCVFDGESGDYSETDEFNAIDLYGISKLQGELSLKSTMTIRTSIVGKEIKTRVSLLEWFLGQPISADVRGFTNHYWNGVTTLAFSKVISGIIREENFESSTIHLIPKDKVSKYELLNEFKRAFNRNDLNLEPVEAERSVDRTLKTNSPLKNSSLWRNAGYNSIPSIAELITEYAEWH